jgi:isopentenyl-diphosphate delta-isomerase
VASHVFRNEDYVQASRRRLREELGLEAGAIEYAFKFRYKASYESLGMEHEICAVTIVRGVAFEGIRPDPDEIDAVRTADLKMLIEQIRADGAQYTPWLVLALEHMSERPIVARAEPVHSGV